MSLKRSFNDMNGADECSSKRRRLNEPQDEHEEKKEETHDTESESLETIEAVITIKSWKMFQQCSSWDDLIAFLSSAVLAPEAKFVFKLLFNAEVLEETDDEDEDDDDDFDFEDDNSFEAENLCGLEQKSSSPLRKFAQRDIKRDSSIKITATHVRQYDVLTSIKINGEKKEIRSAFPKNRPPPPPRPPQDATPPIGVVYPLPLGIFEFTFRGYPIQAVCLAITAFSTQPNKKVAVFGSKPREAGRHPAAVSPETVEQLVEEIDVRGFDAFVIALSTRQRFVQVGFVCSARDILR